MSTTKNWRLSNELQKEASCNWKRRAKIYFDALNEIASGTCCGCCSPDDPQCDVGRAKDAIRNARN